jgi:hypothetical protein
MARIDVPWPIRTRPVRDITVKPVASTVDSSEDALLEAVLKAEEAVKAAEASLSNLRDRSPAAGITDTARGPAALILSGWMQAIWTAS